MKSSKTFSDILPGSIYVEGCPGNTPRTLYRLSPTETKNISSIYGLNKCFTIHGSKKYETIDTLTEWLLGGKDKSRYVQRMLRVINNKEVIRLSKRDKSKVIDFSKVDMLSTSILSSVLMQDLEDVEDRKFMPSLFVLMVIDKSLMTKYSILKSESKILSSASSLLSKMLIDGADTDKVICKIDNKEGIAFIDLFVVRKPTIYRYYMPLTYNLFPHPYATGRQYLIEKRLCLYLSGNTINIIDELEKTNKKSRYVFSYPIMKYDGIKAYHRPLYFDMAVTIATKNAYCLSLISFNPYIEVIVPYDGAITEKMQRSIYIPDVHVNTNITTSRTRDLQ